MEANTGSVPGASSPQQETSRNMSLLESINQSVDQMFTEVNQIDQKINEIEQFYSSSTLKNPNAPKGGCLLKGKEKDKFLGRLSKNRRQDAASTEAAATNRMQDLMRQFRKIIDQLTKHEWAEPFMQPVDVVGLSLHDYYKVIDKPMDFSIIICKMEAEDGNGYKNVREVCADVRLIFKNAMKYNEERNNVHVQAKTLLDKFETKWLQLLPKVYEEEKRQKKEDTEVQLDAMLVQETSYAKMARDLSLKLDKVDAHLEDLKAFVLQNFRKMTTDEKKQLGSAITRLSPEDIDKVLEIISQDDPMFQANGEIVEVDIDAQSEATLWKLVFFVKDGLQRKSSTSTKGNNNDEKNQTCKTRRKHQTPRAQAKTTQRRSKKPRN